MVELLGHTVYLEILTTSASEKRSKTLLKRLLKILNFKMLKITNNLAKIT